MCLGILSMPSFSAVTKNITTQKVQTQATKIEKIFKTLHPQGKFRLDGVFVEQGQMWLPLVSPKGTFIAPAKDLPDRFDDEDKDDTSTSKEIYGPPLAPRTSKPSKITEIPEIKDEDIELIYQSQDQDYFFSNGWIYTPIKENTIKSFDFYDNPIQKQILKNKIIQSFIVPKDFKMPRDLGITTAKLPIEFRDVDLASTREERFLALINRESKLLSSIILTYDQNIDSLKLIKFPSKKDFKDNEIEITDINNLQPKINLLSSFREIDSTLFLVDYNQVTIFKLIRQRNKKKRISRFKLEKYIDLKEVEGLKLEAETIGLRDFAISKEGSLIYLLDNKNSKVLVIDAKTKKLLKEIDTPSNPFVAYNYQISSESSDYILVLCKAANQIIKINTVSQSIESKIKVGKLPISAAFSRDYLLVANKGDRPNGSISIIDWVTSKPVSTISLNSTPSQILLTPDEKNLLVLSAKDSTISVLDLESLTIKKVIDLNPDIIEPQEMAISSSKLFVTVGSSNSDSIGFLDLETLQLVKKIDIGSRSNKITTFKPPSR